MRTIWLIACVGCATSGDARIDAVEPAVVSSLVTTPARVVGERLFAAARADLDRDEATVDRAWQLAIGERALDGVEWVDAQHLSFAIPAGMAPGTYDVHATSPRGEVLVARAALSITAEPIGLALAVEDAPGGGGQPVATTLGAGDTLTAYAVVRDRDGTFITDIAADWHLTVPVGTVVGSATSGVVSATTIGRSRLVATRAAAQLTAETGDIVVVAGPAAALSIEDASGGVGQRIANVAGLTTDGGLTAHAIARDAFGNYVDNAPATWSLSGVTGVVPAAPASTVTVDFTTPGAGVLHALGFSAAQTGTLAVAPGRAAQLVVAPPHLEIDADAAPFTFAATGRDADGNPTTDLGTLAWTVDSGVVTTLAPTGVLDPVTAGTGTIRVTSSFGASANGTITITPGATATLAITPPSLTVDADAAETTFTASASDGDGNPTTTGVLTWSIGSGPITQITPAGVLDPRAAGTGTIAVASSLGPTANVPVTITPGRATTLAIVPATVDVVAGTASVPFSVTATDADANPTTNLGTITWSVASGNVATLDPSGAFVPNAGTGTIRATSSHGATAVSGEIRVRTQAGLTATLTAAASANVAETLTVELAVTNTGETPAVDVVPCALASSGAGAVTVGVSSPATATIPPGATTTFAWPVTATSPGTVQLTSCASGADAVTGNAVTSPPASTTTTIIPPVILTSSLAMPALAGLGKSITITMQVTNTGTAPATAVAPSALSLGGTGSATLALAPTGGVSIAAGATTSFAWTYSTTALGTLVASGNATGTDSVTLQAVSSPITSADSDIVEAALVGGDPFGDGTSFTYVVGYRGHVLVGPNKTGSSALRLDDDLATFAPLSFRFFRDTNNNTSTNTTPIYSSIGAIGCAEDTAACGPDNEDGRGLFASGTIDGTEWLVLGGARSDGNLDYIYMTPDEDDQLDFRFVDLDNYLGGNTHGFSAAHVLGNRLYLGFPDNGGSRPYLITLATVPAAPGIDVTGGGAVDLSAKSFPGWQATSTSMVDSFGDLGGLLYVSSHGGIMAATTATPRAYSSFPADWAVASPSAVAFTARASRNTAKLANLEPRDRAFPQLATFGGRLFAGRNTTVGPQLWSCDPSTGSSATRCEPGDWKLVAPSSSGDTLLTQFNNPALTSITMVVATATDLYVGFDSASGVQVFRTSNPAATSRADFVGRLGCSAALHPATCAGIGGAGFGDPADQRIFDAKVINAGVWITVGNASSALGLVALP